MKVLSCLGLLIVLVLAFTLVTETAAKTVRVKSLVIGSGIGGTYFAYRRSAKLGEDLAILEATNNVCGRIVDYEVVGFTPQNGMRVPGCAARWNLRTMNNLRCLAHELNMTAYCQPFANQFYLRGTSGTSTVELLKNNPKLFGENWYNKNVTDDPQTAALLYVLQNNVNPITGQPAVGNIRDRCANYGSLFDFYAGELNPEYAQFMAATNFGFTGDYLGGAYNPCGYLYKAANEFELANTYCYPRGGMSMYCRNMRKKLKARGSKIYSNDPAISIDYDVDTEKFTVVTKKGNKFISEEIALNLPPVAIQGKLSYGAMKGNVVRKLKNDRHMQAIINTTTITITGQWSQPWWRSLLNDTGDYALRRFEDVRGLNRAEIFDTPNFREITGLRLVYTDNFFVPQWSGLKQGPDGEAVLKAELLRNFRSDPLWKNLTIPDPIKLVYHQQSTAWHFLTSGSPTRDEVVAWAQAPLGKKVKLALMNEAYDVKYNGWSEGSLQLANSALQRFDKQRFTDEKISSYSSCVTSDNELNIPSVLANENFPPYPLSATSSRELIGASAKNTKPGSLGRAPLEVGFRNLYPETLNSIYKNQH